MSNLSLHFRHLINATVILLITAALLPSCGDSDFQPCPDPPADGYDVALRISTGIQDISRGECPEEYGTELENLIDLGDLQILIFGSDGILKNILYADGVMDSETSLAEIGAGEYLLKTKLPSGEYDPTSRFDIVALANLRPHQEESTVAPLNSGITTLDDIKAITFKLNDNDAEESWTPSENSLIPMSGMLTGSLNGYSTQYFNTAVPMELGSIDLIRAVAKIEVIDHSAEGVAEVKSVTLHRRNSRGILMPSSLTGTGQPLPHLSPNIPPDNGFTDNPLQFKHVGNKFVAYVPEMENPITLEGRDYIDVAIEYNDFTEHRLINMAPHDAAGTPVMPADGWPDIWAGVLRNHIYRFTIFSIEADPNLLLTVDVQPFSSVNLNTVLGLERNEDGYIVVRNSEGIVVKYIRTDESVLTMEEVTDWPDLGVFIGVFDDRKKVLIGYFPDGRNIIFNYVDAELKQLESWEIYYPPVDGRLSHLGEIFCYVDYHDAADETQILKHKFTHTLFDDQGRVVEEYRYPSLEAFEKRNEAVAGRKTLADFYGTRYGDKRISYYDEEGQIYCQLIVTGNEEEYLYENFITD